MGSMSLNLFKNLVDLAEGNVEFLSLASRGETGAAIERLHDEMSRAGRALAQKLGFAYPEEVEATARRAWSEFRSGL